MNLQHLQQVFLSYIHDKRGHHQNLLSLCLEPKKGNVTQRLGIYSNNYDASLNGILKKRYPVCLQLVGEDFFVMMTRAFIEQTPSTCLSVDDYGEQFGLFIDHYAPANCLPYLPDVARLEWAWAQAYFGPDIGPIDFAIFADLQSKMADNFVFDLAANAVLLQSQYPIDQIWQLHQNDFDPQASIHMDQTQMQCIVWRRQWEVLIERLTTDEWEVLKLFHAGAHLAEVCEETTDKSIDLGAILPVLIRKGWISGFHYQ